MIDCHIHTVRCRHAEGTPLEYVAAAEAAGVDVMTFTDHLPLIGRGETPYAMPDAELPDYVTDILQLRKRAAAPEVLLGIEADWSPGAEEQIAVMLDAYPFDVVLGSVHFLGHWAFDDPSLVDRYTHEDVDELWRAYFTEVESAARSGLFDVMAHPDLIKKFGFMPSFDPAVLYESAAEAFASADVAVEVNTAGLRWPCAEPYPSVAFLEACRRRGVPATMGSDAHTPDRVGFRMDAAEAALEAAGYDSVVHFRERRPVERALR